MAVTLLAGMCLPAEAARYTIAIEDMAFGKSPPLLQVGDTIVWQNNDIFKHSATARSGVFDVDLAPGKKSEVTLKQAGQVDVFCRYHPTMTLKLMVAKERMK
jgi:plastocyanin